MKPSSAPTWEKIIGIQLTCMGMCVAATWAISQSATSQMQRELDHLEQHIDSTTSAARVVSDRAEGLYERLIDPEILDKVPPAPAESDWEYQDQGYGYGANQPPGR